MELKSGPVYANFETHTPLRVWVVDHEVFATSALEVRPYDDSSVHTGLVWALYAAARVSRDGVGVAIDFWMRGAIGWFPAENASFSEPVSTTFN